MTSSVGTKPRKKQSPSPDKKAGTAEDRGLERSLLMLENACVYILDADFAADRRNTELRMWQQRFKNLVTPVSLALREYKGPRRFHYHYRHREDDESVLHPVLEPSPLDVLAQVCRDALACCRGDLVGIQDAAVIDARRMLEAALVGFLLRYKQWKKKI